MPVKKKRGKQRQDKFYHLAKDQGYRSRAAFKLIQLNKKYDILSSARVVLDLCAAPGGWMQVAAKFTPVSSVVVGVDLVPIKPVKDCKSIVADITTTKCRELLKKELQSWKADVVLHDGAPNMGTSWVQDAFTQNVLTLSALKLATEFLNAGGSFVTKVFRSKDYNSILFVLNKLFKRVDATKPPASRDESAEIFVVCKGFLAPKSIDPRLLDPKNIFADLGSVQMPNVLRQLKGKKEKPNREGYDASSELLYKTCPASSFVKHERPIDALAKYNEFTFEDEDSRRLLEHKSTSTEIVEACKDLKLLGKGDFKRLLRWRIMTRELFVEKPAPQPTPEAQPLSEDQKEEIIDEELRELLIQQQRRQKQKERRQRRKKIKYQNRMDLGIALDKTADLPTPSEEGLFELKAVKSTDHLRRIQHAEAESEDSSSYEDEEQQEDEEETAYTERLDLMLEEMYQQYLEKKNISIQPTKEKKKILTALEQDFLTVNDADTLQEDQMELEDTTESEKHPLLVEPDVANDTTTNMWFSMPVFDDILKDVLDPSMPGKEEEPANKKRKVQNTPEAEDDDFEEVPFHDSDSEYDSDEKAEVLAIGTRLVTGQEKREDLLDAAYNRYAFNDTNLPAWFEQDERKHSEPQKPVTKEEILEIKQRFTLINARPIQKILEAKARKKKLSEQRLNQLRAKAENISQSDLSEAAKMRAIEKLIRGHKAKAKTNKVYVVAGKSGKKREFAPKGTKGKTRIKLVDRRMKTDKRGQKNKERKEKLAAKRKRKHRHSNKS